MITIIEFDEYFIDNMFCTYKLWDQVYVSLLWKIQLSNMVKIIAMFVFLLDH